jgi:TolA-binding protein
MANPDGDPSTADGVAVINNSWGSSSRRPLYNRLMKALTDMGITCVFAAGNSGPGPGTVGGPGHLPEVITVGAVDFRKRVTSFSSRGDPIVNSAEIPIKPDVCAPGYAVLSIGPQNTFQRWPGTSMAAPHVTGVVALMKAVNPGLRPRDLKLILEETAEDLGAPGKDEDYGSGLVNALAAVKGAAALMGRSLEPKDPLALIQQAKDFMRTRRTQYAVENLHKVINNFPELDTATRVEAGYLMGEGFRELGNLKGAVEAYRGVVMLAPESPVAAKAEYWIAWSYLNARGANPVPHARKGIELFEAFLAAHPEHDWFVLASLEAARAHLSLRQRQEAVALLAAAIEAHPNTEHRATVVQMLEALQKNDEDLLEF